jgi:hypothetical protein
VRDGGREREWSSKLKKALNLTFKFVIEKHSFEESAEKRDKTKTANILSRDISSTDKTSTVCGVRVGVCLNEGWLYLDVGYVCVCVCVCMCVCVCVCVCMCECVCVSVYV